MQAKHLLIFLVFLTISAQAQIKLFPAGKTTIGTIITHAALQHRIEGSIAFTSSSADVLRISNSSVYIGTGTIGSDMFMINGLYNTAFRVNSLVGTYGQANVTNVTNTLAKALSTQLSGSEKFFVYGSGDVYGKSFNLNSDSTLKTNIVPLGGTLAKVLQLKGYNYNFKLSFFAGATNANLMAAKPQIGFIAQEVESIFPELVETTDKGLKAVNYDAMIPILLEAIKEQQAKINQLEQKINACCKIGN